MKPIGFGGLLLAIMLTGCSSIHPSMKDEQTDYLYSAEMAGDEKMEKTDMSTTEQELLAAVYPNESQIREGILFEYQKESLQLLRAGEEYLKEKYPNHEMVILSFEPANKFTPWAVIHFQCGDSAVCKAFVTQGDGEYECTDTFYAVLLQPAYDKMLESLLGQSGFTVYSLTNFPNPIGREIGEDADLDTLLKLVPNLTRNTHLFIARDHDEGLADKIKLILHDEGMYGAYTLYFIGESEKCNIYELESERNNFTRVSFTCFDED